MTAKIVLIEQKRFRHEHLINFYDIEETKHEARLRGYSHLVNWLKHHETHEYIEMAREAESIDLDMDSGS